MQYLGSRTDVRRVRRSRTATPTHYHVLGVARDAGPREIVRAYRRCAKRLHPDINPDPDALEQFTLATAAYDTLLHPVHRQCYDASLMVAVAEVPAARPIVIARRLEDGLIGGALSLATVGLAYIVALSCR